MGIIFDYFSRKILWEPFKIICYTIFFTIIILYPFNSKIATILLFWYISLWSRIPTLVSDFTKDLDVLDFFSVIIAVHSDTPYSGLQSGVFAFSLWFLSRVFGPDENFAFTISESIAFFFAGFFTPIVHIITNNILITMFVFTAIRYFGIFIMVAIFFRNHTLYTLGSLLVGIPIALMTNKIMIVFLGPFFKTVFETGLKFNLPLFAFGSILTISVHFITRYMTKNDYLELQPKKIGKKNKINDTLSDNIKNYPEFYST